MTSKPRLFHSIGLESEESAAVRRFVVENNLQEKIEFSNIAYEGPQEALINRIGTVEAPVLFNGEQTVRGRLAIIEWLREHLV